MTRFTHETILHIETQRKTHRPSVKAGKIENVLKLTPNVHQNQHDHNDDH